MARSPDSPMVKAAVQHASAAMIQNNWRLRIKDVATLTEGSALTATVSRQAPAGRVRGAAAAAAVEGKQSPARRSPGRFAEPWRRTPRQTLLVTLVAVAVVAAMVQFATPVRAILAWLGGTARLVFYRTCGGLKVMAPARVPPRVTLAFLVVAGAVLGLFLAMRRLRAITPDILPRHLRLCLVQVGLSRCCRQLSRLQSRCKRNWRGWPWGPLLQRAPCDASLSSLSSMLGTTATLSTTAASTEPWEFEPMGDQGVIKWRRGAVKKTAASTEPWGLEPSVSRAPSLSLRKVRLGCNVM